jgi:hypothetical protein
LINLLHASAGQLDWQHVLNRLDRERPLLSGLLQVFNWVSPDRAKLIPPEIRREFNLPEVTSDDLALPQNYRVELLDIRPWFAAFQPPGEPMKL